MNRKSRFLWHKGTALGVASISAALGARAVQAAELSDTLRPDILSSAVGTIGAYASIVLYPALERIHPGDSYGKNFSYRNYLMKMMKTYPGFTVLGLAYAPIKYTAMKFCERFTDNAFWASLTPDTVLMPTYLFLAYHITKRVGVFNEPLEDRVSSL
jgi:hypothetical protein